MADWYSDQMLGNFFMLTCPYLYDLETVAYFALLRGHHSFHATAPILDTTQLFSDVYRHHDELYIRPLKVAAALLADHAHAARLARRGFRAGDRQRRRSPKS